MWREETTTHTNKGRKYDMTNNRKKNEVLKEDG